MLIGLVSKIGGGKDTVVQIVQELYPELNWQIRGFADKLRQVASLLTGIPAEDMKQQEVKEQMLGPEWADIETKVISGNTYQYPIDLRTLLQRLGTNAVRDGLNPNSWVNALMVDYRPYIDRRFDGNRLTQGYHCSDCISCHKDFTGWKRQRACNECVDAGFKEYPNWLVYDTRFPNELEAITSRGGICIRIVRPDNPHPQSNHISETALDGVELSTIINDGNLDQLRIKVKEVFDPIVHRIRSGDTSVA